MPNETVTLQRLVIHHIDKEQHQQPQSPRVAERIAPINDNAQKLAQAVHTRYNQELKGRRSGSFLPTAECEPGDTEFLQGIKAYCDDVCETSFLAFTQQAVRRLHTILQSTLAARGGYVLFFDCRTTTQEYLTMCVLRNTASMLIEWPEDGECSIKETATLNFEHLAMACRLDILQYRVSDVDNPLARYLSYVDVHKDDSAKYFVRWIVARYVPSPMSDTKRLREVLLQIPLVNSNSDIPTSRQELLARAAAFIADSGMRVRLEALSEHIWNDRSILGAYYVARGYEQPGEFQASQGELKKFNMAVLQADGIMLRIDRSRLGDVVDIDDEENPTLITIRSASLAQLLLKEKYS